MKMKNIKVGFLNFFLKLKDPRVDRTKLYSMEELLFLTICAVICNRCGWSEIELFGKMRLKILRKYLPYKNGAPSDDTLRRFFSSIDHKVFQKCFAEWVQSLNISLKEKTIAIDVKVSRNSCDANKKALYTVSAFLTSTRIVLGQEKVCDGSNEITAIPKLLELIDIKNAIITIDAAGCQKNIAKNINEKDAEYIIALKGNQENLYRDVQTIYKFIETTNLKNINFDKAETINYGHGRTETRICIVIFADYLPQSKEWPGLKTIVQIISIRKVKNKITRHTRYYLSSLDLDAEQALRVIRSHWGIENSLHWILDVNFGDDKSRIRKGNAPQNMLVIKHTVLNLLQRYKAKGYNRLSISKIRDLASFDAKILNSILVG